MQPLLRSSTTSLTVPITWPLESFTVEPMIVLVGMYSVVVLLVVVVLAEFWACVVRGVTARPAKANVAPSRIFLFIGVKFRDANGVRLFSAARNGFRTLPLLWTWPND